MSQYATASEFNGDDDNDSQASKGNRLFDWIINIGINGVGFLPDAKQVAKDHLKSSKGDIEKAINSIITWSTVGASTGGFFTGLGGIATLPVALPAGLLITYGISANTAAAIAYLRGYDLDSAQVRTMVMCCLVGEGLEQVLKAAGIDAGRRVGFNLVKQIPTKALIELNKRIGIRLFTKVGEKGVVNLTKMVPVIGGVVGATFDGTTVNICGKTAKKVFHKID